MICPKCQKIINVGCVRMMKNATQEERKTAQEAAEKWALEVHIKFTHEGKKDRQQTEIPF